MLKQKEPPKISDFSNESINKAVYKTGLTHWLTLYPPAIGIPCGLAGLLFNSPLVCAVGFGACFVSLGNAVVNIFFRKDKIANNYLEELNKKLKKQETYILRSLDKNLKKCASIKGVEDQAQQGIKQFKKIKEKYKNVHELLEQKLNKGEITFGRFIGAAEQVYLSTLDNLKQIVSTLQSAGSIDPGYIKKRLQELTKKSHQKESDIKEIETLNKRLALWEEQLKKTSELLSDNEEAMTKMEETTAAIASIQTGSGFAATDLETAMKQLQELAQRAQIYNKQ